MRLKRENSMVKRKSKRSKERAIGRSARKRDQSILSSRKDTIIGNVARNLGKTKAGEMTMLPKKAKLFSKISEKKEGQRRQQKQTTTANRFSEPVSEFILAPATFNPEKKLQKYTPNTRLGKDLFEALDDEGSSSNQVATKKLSLKRSRRKSKDSNRFLAFQDDISSDEEEAYEKVRDNIPDFAKRRNKRRIFIAPPTFQPFLALDSSLKDTIEVDFKKHQTFHVKKPKDEEAPKVEETESSLEEELKDL